MLEVRNLQDLTISITQDRIFLGLLNPLPLLLRNLRVASIDRLALRLVEAGFETSRAEVVRSLRARDDVQWFGETLVAVKEVP